MSSAAQGDPGSRTQAAQRSLGRSPVTDEATDQILGVAEVLADMGPATWHQLLVKHTADATNHCRTCRCQTGAAPVWPCRLRAIGEEAQRIAAAANRGHGRMNQP